MIRSSPLALALVTVVVLGAGCGADTGETADTTPTRSPASSEQRESRPVPSWELLDCPEGQRSVWMTDPGRPDPGTTIRDLLVKLDDPRRGIDASLVNREVGGPGEVMVALREDGRTVAVSQLDQWGDRGGWYVEGGVNCPGHGLLSMLRS